MSCNIFYIKKGDLLPVLKTTLTDSATGLPVNLSSATAARIRVVKSGATIAFFDRAATISDAVNGKVEYAWNAGDTNDVGDYMIEWEITYGVGYKKTYPSAQYNYMIIVPRLPL